MDNTRHYWVLGLIPPLRLDPIYNIEDADDSFNYSSFAPKSSDFSVLEHKNSPSHREICPSVSGTVPYHFKEILCSYSALGNIKKQRST
jgi:hypothetical protein